MFWVRFVLQLRLPQRSHQFITVHLLELGIVPALPLKSSEKTRSLSGLGLPATGLSTVTWIVDRPGETFFPPLATAVSVWSPLERRVVSKPRNSPPNW